MKYDILMIPPHEKPIYFVVKSYECDDQNAREYHYEARCPVDLFHDIEEIISDGDADPHGVINYVRTTGEVELPKIGYDPVEEWGKYIPEAFVK